MASLDIHAMIVAVTIAILLLTAPHNTNAAITCNKVLSDITPCLSYATNGRGNPSQLCCSGVNRLNSTATTAADRQTTCNCLKNLVEGTNLNEDTVASIPSKCGVNLPYAISTSTDCSQVY